MAQTEAAAEYQVRIATAGATAVEGNVALTLAQSDLAATPIVAGPSVDILTGETVTHPFRMSSIVDGVVFNSGGRFTAIGRLAEVRRRLDGGAWSTISTGRLTHLSEPDGRGRIEVEVSDERWMERRTSIFRTTTTAQVHPPGLANAWFDLEAAGEATYNVDTSSGSAYRLWLAEPNDTGGVTQIPTGLCVALQSDLLRSQAWADTNSAGNFTSLRFRYSGADYTVLGFRETMGPTGGVLIGSPTKQGVLGEMAPDGGQVFRVAWVYGLPSITPPQTITGRFYFISPGVEVSEAVPLHIGGANGVHPGTLMKDVLDGVYGGDVVQYDSASMTDVTSASMRPVWLRVTEPADRSE